MNYNKQKKVNGLDFANYCNRDLKKYHENPDDNFFEPLGTDIPKELFAKLGGLYSSLRLENLADESNTTKKYNMRDVRQICWNAGYFIYPIQKELLKKYSEGDEISLPVEISQRELESFYDNNKNIFEKQYKNVHKLTKYYASKELLESLNLDNASISIRPHGELVCTIYSDTRSRMYNNIIFVLINRNILNIARSNFLKNNKGEDEYGSSLMMIQLNLNDFHVKLIQRYNHTSKTDVDHAFNVRSIIHLNQVIPKLGDALISTLAIASNHQGKSENFNKIEGFINNDEYIGQYYMESHGKYYCYNNWVYDNGHWYKLDKEQIDGGTKTKSVLIDSLKLTQQSINTEKGTERSYVFENISESDDYFIDYLQKRYKSGDRVVISKNNMDGPYSKDIEFTFID